MEFGYHKEGRRFIIDGDTRVAAKGSLGKYGLGLNFDWDAKRWWTAKEDLAQRAVAQLSSAAEKRETTIATSATYKKLPDGSCGVRVPIALLDSSRAVPGQIVKVTKSSGEAKHETLGEVVERVEGDQVTCKIRRAKSDRPREGGRCDECGRYSRRLVSCADSSGLVGGCCGRCAALSRYERSFA